MTTMWRVYEEQSSSYGDGTWQTTSGIFDTEEKANRYVRWRRLIAGEHLQTEELPDPSDVVLPTIEELNVLQLQIDEAMRQARLKQRGQTEYGKPLPPVVADPNVPNNQAFFLNETSLKVKP